MFFASCESMDLEEKQAALIEGLNLITDPQERLTAVVSQTQNQGLPEQEKLEENRVRGCISRVWLVCSVQKGMCFFRSDADSPIVRGLVGLLCDLYSGFPPAQVRAVEPQIWIRCGFDRILSPTRLNGLRAVRDRIRTEATRLEDGATNV